MLRRIAVTHWESAILVFNNHCRNGSGMCWDPEDLGFRCVADLYVRAGYSGSTEDEMCFCRFLISKGSTSYGDTVLLK